MDFQNFLESINQNISEALYRSTKNKLLYANRAYYEMFGFSSEEEMLETAPVDLYKHPEDRGRLIDLLDANGKFDNQEVKFLKRGGEEFIGLISAKRIDSEEGGFFWDGSIRDITAQRAIINQLLDREQLLDSINKNINEAIYRKKADGQLVYTNDEFLRMFGYNREELLKIDVSNLYRNPEDRAKIRQIVMEDDSIFNQEVEFLRKDGSTFWGSLNSTKVKTSDGELYFDGAIRDITKEKQAEDVMRKHAEMQELLIYISSGLISLPVEEIEEATELSLQGLGEFVDADRTYIFEFTDDFSSNEIYSWIKKGISAINAGFEDGQVRKEVREYFENQLQERPFHIADIDRMSDGPLKDLYISQEIKTLLNVPLMRDGKCVGCVGFDWVKDRHYVTDTEILILKLFSKMFINIRERSNREYELKKLFAKTVEQNQRLKDFSYITSHNFRSSVANLMGLLSILEEDRNNDDFFQMMKETTLKLNTAVDSINDLLNFEKDIAALEKKSCNLHRLVTDTLVLNQKASKEKEIHFDVEVAKDLYIKALPAYIQSILHNLITNAMKYGVTADKRNIYIKAQKIGEFVLLTIADKGVGIDMERYGDKMFRLGSRFHVGMDSGHGMGLYITKQQIEAIGGKIEVESKVNEGTTFKVYLNA